MSEIHLLTDSKTHILKGLRKGFGSKNMGMHGSSFPLDIITSANHIINASPLTPAHLPFTRNLSILLQFCVFWDLTPSGAATLQRFLEPWLLATGYSRLTD